MNTLACPTNAQQPVMGLGCVKTRTRILLLESFSQPAKCVAALSGASALSKPEKPTIYLADIRQMIQADLIMLRRLSSFAHR